eukprot:1937781-Amphidinium_carterae.1
MCARTSPRQPKAGKPPGQWLHCKELPQDRTVSQGCHQRRQSGCDRCAPRTSITSDMFRISNTKHA